jgi:hypothetical protein
MDTEINIESELSEMFKSVPGVRRLKRKEEEVAEIGWCPTKKMK